jgi:hypothetical protein
MFGFSAFYNTSPKISTEAINSQAMRGVTFAIIASSLLLASCFDVKEEVILSPSGSGVYQLSIDYTYIMSTFGNNRDSTKELQKLKDQYLAEAGRLKSMKDIHNVNFTTLANNRIFRLGFEFNNIAALNAAISDSAQPRFQMEAGKIQMQGGLPVLANLQKWKAEPNSTEMKIMLAEFKTDHYELQVTVPGKIKKCSNRSAKKTEKNVLNLTCSMADVLEKKSSNAMTIKYK